LVPFRLAPNPLPPSQTGRNVEDSRLPRLFAVAGAFMKTLTGNLLIDGQWRPAAAGATYCASNPTTGEALPEKFSVADENDVDVALRTTLKTFHESLNFPPRWSANL